MTGLTGPPLHTDGGNLESNNSLPRFIEKILSIEAALFHPMAGNQMAGMNFPKGGFDPEAFCLDVGTTWVKTAPRGRVHWTGRIASKMHTPVPIICFGFDFWNC